jgi:hypothetical protein
VVGRLVEDHQVGRVVEQLGQRQPRLLAARQHAHRLQHVVVVEAERAGQVAQRALVGGRGVGLELLEDRAIAAEVVHRVLRVVAHRDRGADRHRAAIRRQRPGHHLQQRRLAGAVLAHHRPALLAAHGQRQAGVDRCGAVGLAQAPRSGPRRRPSASARGTRTSSR